MSQRPWTRRRQIACGGFTLVELTVTLSITIITLTIAVPTFSDLIQSQRLTATTNDLVSALNLSRSEAIQRAVRVTACKSADGSSCSSTGGWEQGWLVFTDPDDDRTYTAASEALILVQEAVGKNVTISGNGGIADNVSYVAAGQVETISSDSSRAGLTVCDDRSGDTGKSITMSRSGAIRTERGIACP